MDMLDQALDSSSQVKAEDSATSDENAQIPEDGTVIVTGESHQTLTHANILDPNIQYQFKAENGQNTVTYRVVQVHDAGEGATAVVATTAAALMGQQAAIITNPYAAANGNDNSPTTTEGQAIYTTQVEEDGSSPAGPFYVMMSPQEVLQQSQRSLAPRSHQFSPKLEGPKTMRDEKRRATHNEVERRRRDKINNWIGKLSKIIPDCTMDSTKQGQSKGGILAKACDYIHELRAGCARVPELAKELEQARIEVQVLRNQCDALKAQNQVLRSLLQQHGVPDDILVAATSSSSTSTTS